MAAALPGMEQPEQKKEDSILLYHIALCLQCTLQTFEIFPCKLCAHSNVIKLQNIALGLKCSLYELNTAISTKQYLKYLCHKPLKYRSVSNKLAGSDSQYEFV